MVHGPAGTCHADRLHSLRHTGRPPGRGEGKGRFALRRERLLRHRPRFGHRRTLAHEGIFSPAPTYAQGGAESRHRLRTQPRGAAVCIGRQACPHQGPGRRRQHGAGFLAREQFLLHYGAAAAHRLRHGAFGPVALQGIPGQSHRQRPLRRPAAAQRLV